MPTLGELMREQVIAYVAQESADALPQIEEDIPDLNNGLSISWLLAISQGRVDSWWQDMQSIIAADIVSKGADAQQRYNIGNLLDWQSTNEPEYDADVAEEYDEDTLAYKLQYNLVEGLAGFELEHLDDPDPVVLETQRSAELDSYGLQEELSRILHEGSMALIYSKWHVVALYVEADTIYSFDATVHGSYVRNQENKYAEKYPMSALLNPDPKGDDLCADVMTRLNLLGEMSEEDIGINVFCRQSRLALEATQQLEPDEPIAKRLRSSCRS